MMIYLRFVVFDDETAQRREQQAGGSTVLRELVLEGDQSVDWSRHPPSERLLVHIAR